MKTTIEWADYTFNPWEGCTKVSPGCTNCYAETRNQRFHSGKNWGKGAPRLLRSDAYWKEPLKWNRDVQFRHTVRPRVFCASLADWLDEEGPIDQLARLLKLIHDTPNLDWLLLSKRTENWSDRLKSAITWHGNRLVDSGGVANDVNFRQWMIDWSLVNNGPSHPLVQPPPNIWIGTSVEDQQRADERIPELLKIPAKVRFLSCEPLLGPVDLSPHLPRTPDKQKGTDWDKFGINWVICGGESGPGARPMHPDWARSLRDQCVAAKVPFLFKQWGEYGQVTGSKIGKKKAGRVLDNREWNEFPV